MIRVFGSSGSAFISYQECHPSPTTEFASGPSLCAFVDSKVAPSRRNKRSARYPNCFVGAFINVGIWNRRYEKPFQKSPEWGQSHFLNVPNTWRLRDGTRRGFCKPSLMA